jgi:hypothetical protein
MCGTGVTLVEIPRTFLSFAALTETRQRVDGNHFAFLRESAVAKPAAMFLRERQRACWIALQLRLRLSEKR